MSTIEELLEKAKVGNLEPDDIIELARYGVKYLAMLGKFKDGIVEQKPQEPAPSKETAEPDGQMVKCPTCKEDGQFYKNSDGYWVVYHRGGKVHYMTRWMEKNKKTPEEVAEQLKVRD